MKLTGELKRQVEKAETKEEAREAIAKAGMLLTDDELDQVSGGAGPNVIEDENGEIIGVDFGTWIRRANPQRSAEIYERAIEEAKRKKREAEQGPDKYIEL